MKFAGFTLNRKSWPTITVGQLKEMNISPADLRSLFGNASLEQTPIGNRTKIGFYLDTGNGTKRPMILKEKKC